MRTIRRILVHAGLFAATLACGVALSLLLEASAPWPAGRVGAVVAGALGLFGYPIVACVAGAARCLRRHRAGEVLEGPLLGRLLLAAVPLAAAAGAGSPGEAMVRGTVTARGAAAVARESPRGRVALTSNLLVDAWGLAASVLGLLAFCSPDPEVREALIWATFITLLVGPAALVALLCVAGLRALVAGRRARWGTGREADDYASPVGAPDASGARPPFVRDNARRRRYLLLPKACSFGAAAALVLLLGAAALLPEQAPAVIQGSPALWLACVLLACAGMMGLVPALVWWAVCSGRSLTQEVRLGPGGRLAYSITSGSGADAVTRTYDLSRVTSLRVGTRCIHVSTPDARWVWIPRTLHDEELLVAELERRLVPAGS